ncbi:MAG: response regulator transcription factor [Betaproteobacteria bacterium]|nr:response regulator transcription factor [Betaproteobacteria bacterium]
MNETPRPIRVVLVDDHPVLLWGLSKLIDGERPRLEVAGTAQTIEEAERLVAREKPDVVLLDLDLGGQSGLDAMPAILRNPGTRIIILTGTRDRSLREQSMLRGASGILSKEAAADTLITAITHVHAGEVWLDPDTTAQVIGRLRQGNRDPEAERIASLTPKERSVIRALVKGEGLPNKVLADRLSLAEHTLRNHLTSIYSKLGVRTRLALYMYAIEHRLGED